MSNQEIKELLENVERPLDDELSPGWWIQKNILCYIDQALILLKKPEQPSSEFTANMRRMYMPKDPRIGVPIEWEYILKLCALLDTSQSRLKDLLEACEKNEKILNICAKVFLGTGEPPESEEFANAILDNKAAIAKAKQ